MTSSRRANRRRRHKRYGKPTYPSTLNPRGKTVNVMIVDEWINPHYPSHVFTGDVFEKFADRTQAFRSRYILD